MFDWVLNASLIIFPKEISPTYNSDLLDLLKYLFGIPKQKSSLKI